MAFGIGTVVTNGGKATAANRLQTTTSRNPFKFLGIGTGATGAARTAAAADTALSTEVETRVSGTESIVTTTVTNDTYQVLGTVAITGTRANDEAGLFDASTVGNMGASATYNVLSLVSGDSLQLTWQIKAG